MESRSIRLLAAGISVAAIVILALSVALWPNQGKNDKSRGVSQTNPNATEKMGLAKSNITAPSKPSATEDSLKKPSFQEIPNTVATPPVREEIGTAQVLDIRTGKMKEVPFTAKMMVLMQADGTPLKTAGSGSLVTPANDGTMKEGKVEWFKDGAQSRPARPPK